MRCLDETTLTLFLERRLGGERVAVVERHLDECSECRRLVSTVAQQEPTLGDSRAPTAPRGAAQVTLEPGATIDRYVVVRVLGTGATGTVYAARDPALDRDVAVKLYAAPEQRDRLLDEARALAKVSSPNVVAIHDVGVAGDHIYMTLELVQGGTLRSWLRERPRSWREIVRVMAAAGRGLAHVHACGLVHRDFKPDNVLVDGDRVRVADFGLASFSVAGPDAPSVAGTPRFMAPEVLAGKPADPRSDQFGFSVALYEALFSTWPFPGDTLTELIAALERGELRAPPRTVPAWLRAVVARGLAVDPAARFPTMDAVVARLERGGRGRTVLAVAGGAVAVAAIGIGVAIAGADRDDGPTCSGFEAQLAGAWDPGLRMATHGALVSTRAPNAAATSILVRAALDDYASSWARARTEVCEATHRRGEQSERLLELRMRCLDRRRSSMDALVRALLRADAKIVPRAVDAARGLEPAATCARIEHEPEPPSAVGREREAQWQHQLADASAAEVLGRYRDSQAGALAVATAAHAAGAGAIEARALVVAGRVSERLGEHPRSDQLLRDAALAAEAIRLDDVVAEARLARIRSAVERHRIDEANELVLAARAAIRRTGDPSTYEETLAAQEGILYARQGKYEDARARFTAGLELSRARVGELHPRTASAYNNLGGSLLSLNRYEEARATYERALMIRRATLGDLHPQVGGAELNLAMVLSSVGRHADAVDHHRRALEILEGALGPEHPNVANALTELAGSLSSLGRRPEALGLHRRALAIQLKLGAERLEVALVRTNIADTLDELGRREDALAEYRIALAIREKTLGPEHPHVGQSLNNMASTLHTLGRSAEAKQAYERAIALKQKALGPDHPSLAHSLYGLGEVELETGHAARAVAPLERAVTLFAGADPIDLAKARLVLARALAKLGRTPERVKQLAQEARAVLAKSSEHAKELAQADAVLDPLR